MKRLILLFFFMLSALCYSEKALFSYEEYSIPREIEVSDFLEFDNGKLLIYNGGDAFLSTDSGNSWANVTQSNSNTIWGAATDGKAQIYLSAGDLLLHSSDAGQSWEPLLTEIAPYSYNQFVMPDGRLGYLDGKNICIFKNIVGATEVHSVTFPVSNVRLLPYGGFIALDTNCNVWLSDKLGGEWTKSAKISNILLDYTIPIAIGNSGQIALMLGRSVFCSHDYGLTWQNVIDNKPSNFILRFADDGTLKVLSTSDSLLTKYSFDGSSWTCVDSTKLPIEANTFYIAQNGDMFVGTFSKELLCLRKGSAIWKKCVTGLPPKSQYYVQASAEKVIAHNGYKEMVEMLSADSFKVTRPKYGCSNYTFLSPDADTVVTEFNDTLFFSRDGGQSWTPVADSIGYYFESRVAKDFSGRYFRVTDSVIIWTTDCGRNWKRTRLNYQEKSQNLSACILGSGKVAYCNSIDGIMCFDPQTETFSTLDASMKEINRMADIGNDELLIDIGSYISKYNIKTKKKTAYLCMYTTAEPGVQVFGNTWYAFSANTSFITCDSGKTWRPLPTPNSGRQKSAAIGPDGAIYSIGTYGLFKLTPNEGHFDIKSLSSDSVQFIGNDFVAQIEHQGIPTGGNCEVYYYGGMFRTIRVDAKVKDYSTLENGDGTTSASIVGAYDRKKMLILYDRSYPIVQINSDKKYITMGAKKVLYCRARDIIGDSSACIGQMFELNTSNLLYTEMPLLWLNDTSTTLLTFHDSPIARLAIYDTGYHCLKLIGYSDTTRMYSDTVEKWIYVRDIPAKPSITRINDTTLSATEGNFKYQWYLFTTPIEGATSPIYQSSKILDGGFYTVTVEDTAGCISMFSDEYYNPAEDLGLGESHRIEASPNPASSEVNLRFFAPNACRATVSIAELTGITVFRAEKELSSIGIQSLPVDVSALASGIYFVSVTLGTETYRTKLIIER